MDKRSRRVPKAAAVPANDSIVVGEAKLRPTRAAAKAPRRDAVCLEDDDDDCVAAHASDADRSRDESSDSSPVKAKKKAPKGRGKKQVRMQRAAALTSSGERADLSGHALGRLFLTTPALFAMFSTKDIRHVRRADKALRSLVAEHPWDDATTPVHHLLTEWRTSFPAATAVCLDSTTLSKGQLAQLAGLTSFSSVGFRSKVVTNELPLSAVRTMPRLGVLTVTERPTMIKRARGWRSNPAPMILAPTAAVWGELKGLCELTLAVPATVLPDNLLACLNGAVMRKLRVTVVEHGNGYMGQQNERRWLTDSAIAALPLLEELALCNFGGDPSIRYYGAAEVPEPLFSGSGLASLPRLSTISLTFSYLPPGILAHVCPSLRVLDLSSCSGIVDATLSSSPSLGGLRSLILHGVRNITSEAFAGLTSLEELDISNSDSLLSDATLAVLGSFGQLRRLVAPSSHDTYLSRVSRSGLISLSRCPLEELDVSGHGNLYFPSIRPHGIAPAVVPESAIPCADGGPEAAATGAGLAAVAHVPASGIELFASLRVVRASGFCANYLAFTQLVTLDCTGSNHVFGVGSFASLSTLRSLNLSGCRYASREAVLALPPCITSLGLDNCEHLEIDDAMLRGIGSALPLLSHLSLRRTLISETDPTFRKPRLALQRQRRRGYARTKVAAAASAAAPDADSDCSSDSGSDAESPTEPDSVEPAIASAAAVDASVDLAAAIATPTEEAGGWMARRHAAFKAEKKARWEAKGLTGTPPHTSVVGWTALLRLPRGLFSLDLGGCSISHPSYALLRAHVAELRAAKVASPAELAASTVRRSAKRAAQASLSVAAASGWMHTYGAPASDYLPAALAFGGAGYDVEDGEAAEGGDSD